MGYSSGYFVTNKNFIVSEAVSNTWRQPFIIYLPPLVIDSAYDYL